MAFGRGFDSPQLHQTYLKGRDCGLFFCLSVEVQDGPLGPRTSGSHRGNEGGIIIFTEPIWCEW